MKWRNDKYWTNTLDVVLSLSKNHTLIIVPDEFINCRDVFFPLSQSLRLDLLTLKKVSAFAVQKDIEHVKLIPHKILEDDFEQRYQCIFANEVFVVYSSLEEKLTLSKEGEQHIPAFLELRKRIHQEGEHREAVNTLPYILDSQQNRVFQLMFPNQHYVVELFRDLSREPSILRREVFKYCVTDVRLEISAFCNRSCSYCPVSILGQKRKDKTIQMSLELLNHCIDDLAEIDFDGTIWLCHYNEPLYDREYLFSALKYINNELPACKIKLVSNGDYLTKDYLKDLTEYKIDELTISVHYQGNWDRKKQIECINVINNSLNLPETGDLVEDDRRIIYFVDPCAYDSSQLRSIEMRSEDFNVHGVDRAGSLTAGVYRINNHDHCIYPITQFNVAYDGTLVPCCNMCSDVPEIKEYTYDMIENFDDIFSAYTCAKAAEFRRLLFAPRDVEEYTPEPCRMCSVAEYDGESKLYRLDDTIRREIYDCWLSDSK